MFPPSSNFLGGGQYIRKSRRSAIEFSSRQDQPKSTADGLYGCVLWEHAQARFEIWILIGKLTGEREVAERPAYAESKSLATNLNFVAPCKIIRSR